AEAAASALATETRELTLLLRTSIDMFVVPAQVVRARRIGLRRGNEHLRSMKRVVRQTVSIILLEARADFHPMLRRDRQVALIEQPVQIGTEQNAVAHVVRTMLRVRLDVRRFQCWQRMLLGDSTGPSV